MIIVHDAHSHQSDFIGWRLRPVIYQYILKGIFFKKKKRNFLKKIYNFKSNQREDSLYNLLTQKLRGFHDRLMEVKVNLSSSFFVVCFFGVFVCLE